MKLNILIEGLQEMELHYGGDLPVFLNDDIENPIWLIGYQNWPEYIDEKGEKVKERKGIFIGGRK